MGRMKVFMLAMALVLAGPLLAEQGENAAVRYKKAFELLPKLSPKEEELICCGKVRTVPLNAEVLAIISKSKPSLEMLLAGSKCSNCNWGAKAQPPMQSLIDICEKVRRASDLAILQTREHIQEQQPQAGVELVLASLTMNRRLAANGPLISYSLQISDEIRAAHTIGDNLMNMDKTSLQTLAKGLEELPQRASLSEAILHEKDFVDPGVKKNPYYSTAVSFQQEVAKIAEARPEVFEEKLGKVNNFWKGNLGPIYAKMNQRQAETRATMAMLKAAITLILEGEERFKAIKDPYGDGPFEYKKLARGFELASKLQFMEEPVTLEVGGSQ